ncbi:MAG: hypothetical protein HFF36_03835 [Coprobacillus sp.]|nr:hypothetical protein [Coprobacillus sp.]
MKKILTIILVLLLGLVPINTFALENNVESRTIEYLGDGIYVETTIECPNISTYATNTVTKTKTNKYTDSSGAVLYTVSVTGTFKYTGTSSTCTSATVQATAPASSWKVTSKSASKSGNKATGKATVKQYYDGSVVQIKSPSVTLTCSATGVLS